MHVYDLRPPALLRYFRCVRDTRHAVVIGPAILFPSRMGIVVTMTQHQVQSHDQQCNGPSRLLVGEAASAGVTRATPSRRSRRSSGSSPGTVQWIAIGGLLFLGPRIYTN